MERVIRFHIRRRLTDTERCLALWGELDSLQVTAFVTCHRDQAVGLQGLDLRRQFIDKAIITKVTERSGQHTAVL